MKQTVLVTGGTGLVGKALTKVLVKKGYKVIVLTRNANNRKQGEDVLFAAWNVEKKQIDVAALLQADYIIHLAGAAVVEKKWTAAYKKEIQDSRTESSRLIIDVLRSNPNRVRAIISASAIGWYGANKDTAKPFTEDDAADESFLGQTCKLWEAGIDPVTNLGKRLVKLRIGIVLSNDGGALAEFKKPLRFGFAGILGDGRQIVSWIHIDDLCSMCLAAIENESLRGSYNAVGPNPVSNKELTLALVKAMKKKFYIPIYVPAFVLKLIMGQSSTEVLKSVPVSCQKIQDAGFEFKFKTIEVALEDLVTTNLH